MATTFFEDILKEKPKVPTWQDIDPSKIQLDTLTGNAATFDAAKALASQYNDFAAKEMEKRLAQTQPYFAGLESQTADLFSQKLKGQLSLSDAAASQRSSAANALGLGIAGSPAGGALTLRDLGLKQYQVQSDAMAQLPSFLGSMAQIKRAPMFDIASMFLNPAQRWQMAFQNQENKWNQQWLSNQIDAMPSGLAWAFAKQGDEDITLAKQAAVGMFGGGMGMGGGGGGGWGGGGIASGPGGAAGGWGGV